MCSICDWPDAAKRAHAVAMAQPDWKTNSYDFFESMAKTIEDKCHATERQLEVIEEGEEELEGL